MNNTPKFALGILLAVPLALSFSACGDDGNGGGGETFCLHQCSSDADCTINGMDVDLSCVDSRCTGEVEGCTTNDECVAQLSGWMTECTSGGSECMPGQICIEAGLCAIESSDVVSCTDLMLDDIETNDIDGAAVTVCGQASAECSEGACRVPCQSDDDCTADFAPVCNTATGNCECGTDEHCATTGNAATSVCNAGVCGCGSDQNCVDGDAGDRCFSGTCGCSNDDVCDGTPNNFDGGSITCSAP